MPNFCNVEGWGRAVLTPWVPEPRWDNSSSCRNSCCHSMSSTTAVGSPADWIQAAGVGGPACGGHMFDTSALSEQKSLPLSMTMSLLLDLIHSPAHIFWDVGQVVEGGRNLYSYHFWSLLVFSLVSFLGLFTSYTVLWAGPHLARRCLCPAGDSGPRQQSHTTSEVLQDEHFTGLHNWMKSATTTEIDQVTLSPW